MKSFPKKLTPKNKDSFLLYKKNRDTCFFRKRVLEYMYSGSRDGIDLTIEGSNAYGSNASMEYSIDSSIVNTIREELHELGWKTKLCFGDTFLHIYSEDEKSFIDNEIIE